MDESCPNFVCKLQKAFYGLKLAPRAQYDKLKQTLIHNGFENSLADLSLFVFKRENTQVYVLIYVDNILLTGPDSQFIQGLIVELNNQFSLKDLGKMSFFLGLEANRSVDGLLLYQTKLL